jgi:hypothetical protein
MREAAMRLFIFAGMGNSSLELVRMGALYFGMLCRSTYFVEIIGKFR